MPEKATALGIIGLGIIGSRVATNYRDAGQTVWLWNRSPKPLPGFLGSPLEVAHQATRIFIYVADGPACFEVIERMAPALTPGHLIVNHSTISPAEAREIARRVEATGAKYLDAPFTGSRDAAAQRQLVYYIGGEDAVFQKVEAILQINAKCLLPMGKIGEASLMKLATNMVSASTVSAIAEALAVVRAASGDPEKFVVALANNASRSATSDLKLPSLLQQDFAPRFSLKHMLKDMRLAHELAASHQISLPTTDAFITKAAAQVEQGRGDDDFSVIGKTA